MRIKCESLNAHAVSKFFYDAAAPGFIFVVLRHFDSR